MERDPQQQQGEREDERRAKNEWRGKRMRREENGGRTEGGGATQLLCDGIIKVSPPLGYWNNGEGETTTRDPNLMPQEEIEENLKKEEYQGGCTSGRLGKWGGKKKARKKTA